MVAKILHLIVFKMVAVRHLQFKKKSNFWTAAMV